MRLTISGSASELAKFMHLAEQSGCKIESGSASTDQNGRGRASEKEQPGKKRMDYVTAQWRLQNRIERHPYGVKYLLAKMGVEYKWNALGQLLDFWNPQPKITPYQMSVLANELGMDIEDVQEAFNCPKYENPFRGPAE